MTIRRLVIAALLASAGAAHADPVVSDPAPPSAFLTGWTTGNGTDILNSGVLQGGLNLIGGVAYTTGTGSDANLADVLYGKVAGTIGQVDGQTKLFFQRGIEASYLLASGHGILAATLGPGKSVVGSADGAVISDALTQAPGMSGGGGSQGSGGGGGSNTTNTNTNTGTSGSSGSNGVTDGNGSNGNGQPPTILLPEQSNKPNANGQAIPAAVGPAEVPEPSSIALMLLGMVGAGAATRRRTR
jgi:hypothetical protein